MAPDISIITVAFNSEKTIERTIKSMLKQSFTNYEYIIVDGGSTDKTNEIIRRNTKFFDGKITHISEPDNGIYDAMNKGISLAKGKLIGLLNSDDYYFDTTLALVYKTYLTTDLKSVITGELIFKSKDKEQLLTTSRSRFLKKMKQYKNGLRHPATFVPKIIYNEIGLFDLGYKIASDAELIFRIYRANYTFVFLNKALLIMADGGVSNATGITDQILLEKKQLLNAYCSSGFERVFYMYETKLRFWLKDFGGGLIYAYRKLEKN